MRIALILLFSSLFFNSTFAQISARLFQYPDVSRTHITFSYGGDIWTVAKEGGNSQQTYLTYWKRSFSSFFTRWINGCLFWKL